MKANCMAAGSAREKNNGRVITAAAAALPSPHYYFPLVRVCNRRRHFRCPIPPGPCLAGPFFMFWSLASLSQANPEHLKQTNILASVLVKAPDDLLGALSLIPRLW
ncbi:hypothetical protein Ddc_02185 [Ditylenchus destructor]|nr:hypothetical protein Ddc_02185 [Ditylenchus destructor]